MSKVISIHGNSNNPRALEIENMYEEQKQECIEHFESFMRDLIIEDHRHKKNIRYIRSKKLINCGMALHITYIEVINCLFSDYLSLFGETSFIKKNKSFFNNKLLTFFDKNLEPYLYLVDIKKVEAELYQDLN